MKIHWLLSITFIYLFLFTITCCGESRWDDSNEGIELIFDISPETGKNENNTHQKIMLKKITKRLDDFGITRKKLEIPDKNTLTIQVPLYKELDRVKKIITLQGNLEIRPVIEDTINKSKHYKKLNYKNSSEKLLVGEDLLLNNDHIKKSTPLIHASTNSPYILIEFNNIGAKLFSDLSERYIGKRLAIIIDDYIYTAPVLIEKITGDSINITSDFTVEDTIDLSIILNNSPLPGRVTLRDEKVIDHDRWANNN